MIEAETMITFDQTLDAVERIHDHLKSVAAIQSQLEHGRENLQGFAKMLDYAHQREFKSTQELLTYIDKVLVPQLQGIITAFESGTEPHLNKLQAASEHTKRLLANLQLVTGSSTDGLE